jgi:arginine deiminase
MVGPLLRVMVCSPRTAGWDQPERADRWQQLGFLHAPNFAVAQSQHQTLCRELTAAGAEILELPANPSLSLDAVYTHDPSLATDAGLIAMRPGKPNRVAEAALHSAFIHSSGMPILGSITAPGATEAGDIVWLDSKTLLVGLGFRTNQAGAQQLQQMLAPAGVKVVTASLPYGQGPAVCLHLMSFMSMLDDRTILVDLPFMAVETYQLLQSRGFKLIEIAASERDTLACNVLALGNNRLLAIEENRSTNDRLRQAGFDVRTFPGAELCANGGGGPTCLTRPLLRG